MEVDKRRVRKLLQTKNHHLRRATFLRFTSKYAYKLVIVDAVLVRVTRHSGRGELLVCKYPLVEGDVLEDKIKSISYEVSFQASPNGGCACKMMSEYDAAGDLETKEEEIRGGKERAMGMYKVVEAYLFESPGAYE